MAKKNILITGGSGQVASSLASLANARDVALSVCGHAELDICHKNSIEQAINRHSPAYIINTAAYTAVDKAESEIEAAMQANYVGAELLAQACQSHGIPLIHLSTDYVFDGAASKAYTEDSSTRPINVYGDSKLRGELAIRQQLKEHIILRVSAVYSEFGHNFLKSILRLAKERKQLTIVSDQFTRPSYAGDIAELIYRIIDKKIPWGTYHFCGEDTVSWYEFACRIIEAAKHYTPLTIEQIIAIKTLDYQTPAPRPLYSVLDCHKLNKLVELEDTGIDAGIDRSLKVILQT